MRVHINPKNQKKKRERILYYFFKFSSNMACDLQICQMEELVKEYGIGNGQGEKKN